MARFVSALIASALLWAVPAAAEEPSDAALTFVAGFSDQHLAGMLSRLGARSPALAAFAQVNGTLTEATFDGHVSAAVKEHGPAWRRNLALAWTPLLSEEELTSLTNAGAQSPFADKYLDLRDEAGQSMQSLSEDLFREILTDVLADTVRDLTEAPG